MEKKILFVARNLCVGGIQTSLINLLKKLSSSGNKIDLFSFAPGELSEKLPAAVNVIYGGRCLKLISTPLKEVVASKKFLDIIIRIFLTVIVRITGSEYLYRKLFKNIKLYNRYEKAVSYFNDVPTGYFNRGTNLFVAEYVNAPTKTAWIHTDPILSGFDRNYCLDVYRNFDEIVCVSNAVKQKTDMLLPEYAYRTKVVYNAFDEGEILSLAEEYSLEFDKNKFNIITVGRIDNASKRIDGIIRICKQLKDEDITDFCWRIVGSGPDLSANLRLAAELHTDDVVIFEGEKVNPYPYIKNSDLFALYSMYEGYPMVIGEALIIGTPILTKEYAAAKEQIPEKKGVIVNTDNAYYNCVKKYILDKNTDVKGVENHEI